MVRKKAILYIESIYCHKHKEFNGDDIYFNVYGDGKLLCSPGCWNMKKGETDRVDLEIECTYLDELSIQVEERTSRVATDQSTICLHASFRNTFDNLFQSNWIIMRHRDVVKEKQWLGPTADRVVYTHRD